MCCFSGIEAGDSPLPLPPALVAGVLLATRLFYFYPLIFRLSALYFPAGALPRRQKQPGRTGKSRAAFLSASAARPLGRCRPAAGAKPGAGIEESRRPAGAAAANRCLLCC